jgi:spore coat polysaccharide biosynthesis protein SpsF
MLMNKKTAIILQARTGSTRLPGKAVLPFFEGKGIFQIILENLKTKFPAEKIILATTEKSADDQLVEIANSEGILVFRGNEADVLDRFVGAAKKYDAENIIRVCADNPFLLPGAVQTLIDASEKTGADYVSFSTEDGTPVIRSHWGLFAEAVKRDALERVVASTDLPLYHEHVTNYIYEHPGDFKVNLIRLPEIFNGKSNYRFTLDTPADFELLRDLYLNLFRRHGTGYFSPEQLFGYLENEGKEIHAKMKIQIGQNAK